MAMIGDVEGDIPAGEAATGAERGDAHFAAVVPPPRLSAAMAQPLFHHPVGHIGPGDRQGLDHGKDVLAGRKIQFGTAERGHLGP